MKKFILALSLLFSTSAFAQNYTATQGTGTTFGSKLVSAVNYPQFVVCDPTTPAQCAAVDASGRFSLIPNTAINIAQINGVTVLMGNGATGTGSQRITIANDNTIPTGWPTAANQTSQITQETAINTVLGAQADAICGTATGTCTLQALVKFLNTAATAATPAGEFHIGEIGSNQIKVQVAQTVTASAYSTGNALGGLMTIANAARVSGSAGAAGTGGILTGLQLNSKTIQTGVQVDVFIFDANPTGSTCTDKTAFVIAAADFDKVVGILTIPSTAANGAGWFGATTTGAVGIPIYYPVTYDLASSTSIYACAVVRAAITPAATTDISFKYNIMRN